MRRVGIFGGTFDPIHTGHLVIAEELAQRLTLDQCCFVPTGTPYHKPGRPISSAAHRYAMTSLAVAGNPLFRALDVEIRRPGPSYTIDTLEELRGQMGSDAAFFVVIGVDAFLEIRGWKTPERILKEASLVVVPRAGFHWGSGEPPAPDLLRRLGRELALMIPDTPWVVIPPPPPGEVCFIRATSLPIAASELRRRVRAGRSIRYLVPSAVADYIASHNLYREETRP